MPRSPSKAAAAGLFAFAITARLLYSRNSLDADEMATAAWAIAKTPGEVLQLLRFPIEGNAGGYPLFIWAWSHLFGASEFALRFPSALFGAATAALLYWYCAERVSRSSAFVAAALWSVSAMALTLGQLARGYSLWGLFSFLSLLCCQKLLDGQRRWAIPFIFASTISFYLSHLAFLYAFPLFCALAWRALREDRRLFLPPLVALALYLPHVSLLLFQLQHGPRWQQPFEPGSLISIFTQLTWLHFAIPSLAAGALMALGLLTQFRRFTLLALWALFPLAAAFVLERSIFVPIYFFPSGLALFALAAAGMDFRSTRIGAGLGAGATLFAVAGLPAFYNRPISCDWRGASQFILAHRSECGPFVVTDPYWMQRWPYYLGNGFEVRHWNDAFPTSPFWLAGAGHPPMPRVMQEIGERMGAPRWQGTDALVFCVKPPKN